MEQQLLPLLDAVFHPAAASDAKRAAETELRRLSRLPGAVPWAAAVLQPPAAVAAAAPDHRLLYFAATVLEDAAQRHTDTQRSALRACLWQSVLAGPHLPHFVAGKLAAALAHLACVDFPTAWPDYWQQQQAALADASTLDRGLMLLAAVVEQYRALAATGATAAGAKGKARLVVLSSQLPELRARYQQLQPAVLSTLASLLQGLAPALPSAAEAGDRRLLSAAVKALQVLRSVIQDLPSLSQLGEGLDSASLAGLLADHALQALRLARPGSPGEEGALAMSAAAADCVCDLLTKHDDAAAAQRMLAELCDATQQRWVAGGTEAFQPEDPALASLVRLLAQTAATQLGRAKGSPELTAGMLALLAAARRLMEVRRSPLDMLLFLEPFHGVLSHLESLEDGGWEQGGDEAAAAARAAQASQALQAPLLDAARLLLATLLGGPVAPGQPAPPFTLAALDAAPGSGAAADDLLQAVLSGGDAGEQAEEQAAEAAGGGNEEEEEEDRDVGAEVLVASSAQQSPFQAESEADVYVRHCEAFLARAVGTFPAELLPPLLQQLQAAQAGFAQVCEALAGGQGGSVAGAAAALAQLDVLLRLLARAGPHLVAAGAPDSPPGPLTPGVRPSSAHAAQAFSAAAQLAAVWLHAVQRVAAASPGEPFTPVHGRAGQLASLSAFLAMGARIHKCLGALCATWLPQLMIVQAAAGGGAAAAAVAQLVEAQLQAAAALLASLPRLPHWQGVLHRVALAATEGLVALASIALSSSMRPPAALLRAAAGSQHYAALQQVAHASLQHSMLLPAKARRALFVALSDLALRCWASQPAATFDAPSQAAQLGAIVGPLLQCLQQAAAAATLDAQLGAAALRATVAACSIVQSAAGSPKPVRAAFASGLARPALECAVPLARRGLGSAPRLAAAALQLAAATLEALGTELSTEAVEHLLGALVQALDPGAGGDPTLESHLLLLRMLCSALSGAASRHGALLLPALAFASATWEQAGNRALAPEADAHHVRAAALAAMLSLLRFRWRALAGGVTRPAAAAAPAGAAGGGGGAHPLAASLQASAAAAAAAAAGSGGARGWTGGSAEGSAAIARVMALLVDFFETAASGHTVLLAGDVRLVLEELYDLHVAAKLFASPHFDPARERLAAALLAMLLSRCYTAAHEPLADTLFGLAAANWSAWHLSFLPAFVEARLPRAAAGDRAALLARFGSGDLGADDFERSLLAFLNDAAYLERTCC